MIAGFIFYSGKLINAGELEVNNFFISCSNDVSLSTSQIFSYNKYDYSSGYCSTKRIFTVIDKPIEIKNDENLPVLSVNKCEVEFKNEITNMSLLMKKL